MKELIGVLLTMFTLMGLLLTLIIAPVYYVSKIGCEKKYEFSYFGFYEGCMVKYNGKYIPETLYEKSFIQNLNINLNKYE